jgi:plasmid stability protein
VKARGLAAGWIATVLVLVLALGWTISQTIALGRSGASADVQRAALAQQVDASRQKMQDELAAKVELLKDLRWSPERPTAADVIRRLADLARDGHAKVSAVAPVDKDSTARARESSHRIEMAVSFHEIVDFATKVERDGGILEEVVLEVPPAKPGEQSTPVEGLSAQFRLTTIEPSDDARQIMRRVLAASAKNPKFALTSALALPMDVQAQATPLLRDPFQFAEAPSRRRGPASVTAMAKPSTAASLSPPPPPPVVVPLTVKGIVKFPGGAVAIVNDQIVKVGDLVEGQRVEEIADGRVVLHEPGSGSRSLPLAGFAPLPPAPLMRK